jgi:hypothetical protein
MFKQPCFLYTTIKPASDEPRDTESAGEPIASQNAVLRKAQAIRNGN